MVQKSIHRTNKPTLLNPFGETYLHLGNWWNPKLYPDPLGSIEAAHSLPQFSFSPILFGSKEKTSPFFLGLKFLSSPFVFGADATNPQKQKNKIHKKPTVPQKTRKITTTPSTIFDKKPPPKKQPAQPTCRLEAATSLGKRVGLSGKWRRFWCPPTKMPLVVDD